jgi:hypothetical protein
LAERRRAGSAARAVLALSALGVIGSIVAACGGDAVASGASGSPGAGGATRAPAATNAGGDTPLVVDARLLRVLPAAVAGVAMQPSPESAARMVTDTSLAETASAIAVGVVVAAGNSLSDDLAVSTVIQLRPGVFDDQFYQGWRDAYDRAACEPAGGVASHVQQLIGPHTVEVTVCGGGARTYHTYLPGDRLVSITAVGDRKFGDLVMAGLRQ